MINSRKMIYFRGMKRNYELTILISPNLSEQEAVAIQQNFVSFVQEKEGKLIDSSKPAKRILGYEIEKHTQAYITDLTFSLDSKLVGDLEKKVKEEDNIIRSIVLVKEEITHKAPETFSTETSENKKTIEERPAQKANLNDIDKKIDEILSE